MSGTFLFCTSLEKSPSIPSSVTDMSVTFQSCANLAEAPSIPEGVTNMANTFSGCIRLNGIVQINSLLVSDMSYCFSGISELLTVKVPANSTTYETIRAEYENSENITIVPFDPETTE